MASMTEAGTPLADDDERNSACNLALPVTRFAPGSASASRMMLKVCDSIIRSVRRSNNSSEISSREMPMPLTRWVGVKRSGPPARTSGISASRKTYWNFISLFRTSVALSARAMAAFCQTCAASVTVRTRMARLRGGRRPHGEGSAVPRSSGEFAGPRCAGRPETGGQPIALQCPDAVLRPTVREHVVHRHGRPRTVHRVPGLENHLRAELNGDPVGRRDPLAVFKHRFGQGFPVAHQGKRGPNARQFGD